MLGITDGRVGWQGMGVENGCEGSGGGRVVVVGGRSSVGILGGWGRVGVHREGGGGSVGHGDGKGSGLVEVAGAEGT